LKPSSVKTMICHIRQAFVEAGVSDWVIKTCVEDVSSAANTTRKTVGFSLEYRGKPTAA